MAHLDLQRGNYAAAETLLGARASRKIGHNTRLERLGPDRIGVRYHATVIYTMTRDGWAIVNTGGYDTVTTWARINALIPGPYSIHSNRGTRSLYRSGYPILPYADGIAVNVYTGDVGYTENRDRTPGVLLTAAMTDDVVAAGENAERTREEKRQARLLRDHPIVRVVSEGTAGPHRQGYNGRARGCDRCTQEERIIRDIARDRLREEHAAILAGDEAGAGTHRRERTDYTRPKDAQGRTDYSGDVTRTIVVEYHCPWDCPSRGVTATYGDVLLTLGSGIPSGGGE